MHSLRPIYVTALTKIYYEVFIFCEALKIKYKQNLYFLTNASSAYNSKFQHWYHRSNKFIYIIYELKSKF